MRTLVCLFSKASSIYCCPLSAEDVMVNEAAESLFSGSRHSVGVGAVEEQTINELMSKLTSESSECLCG